MKCVVILSALGMVVALTLIESDAPNTMAVADQIKTSANLNRSGHRSGQTQFDLLAKLLADNHRGRDENAILATASSPNSAFQVLSQPHPLLEKHAPGFTLFDADGHPWNLDEKLTHGPVALVFYLNYGCDACVTGLFELNSDLRIFEALGAEVVAISNDPPELTQKRFLRYGRFSFPVLSDPDHEVAADYSLITRAIGDTPERILHGTFVISQDHRITWVHSGTSPFTSNTALFYELARLKRASSEKTVAPVVSVRNEVQ